MSRVSLGHMFARKHLLSLLICQLNYSQQHICFVQTNLRFYITDSASRSHSIPIHESRTRATLAHLLAEECQRSRGQRGQPFFFSTISHFK